MKVYTIMVMGLGDDEHAYESCGIHATREGAERHVQRILNDMADDGTDVDDVKWQIHEDLLQD